MKNILYDLYSGNISGWERRPIRSKECIEVNNKIKAEKQYFKDILTPTDFERLGALENLYTQAGEYEETDAYVTGLRLGVMLMCAVFYGE